MARGVRQGDPMSCLLFNLAIKSLAQMLWDSDLKGVTIDDTKKLIAKLFADDTTVYMAEEDSIKNLQEILDKWCKASGRKFNTLKTTLVPFRNKIFQETLIRTRQQIPEATPIDTRVHIARDSEATRLLGAFIGNKVDCPSIWTPTIEKIKKDLDRWGRGHPTIDGKCLIIGMVVGGRTQYQTCIQGMPKEIEQQLTKIISTFFWGEDNRPTASMEMLHRPIAQGGEKLLDIKSRNKAIELMKTKRYLNLGETRHGPS